MPLRRTKRLHLQALRLAQVLQLPLAYKTHPQFTDTPSTGVERRKLAVSSYDNTSTTTAPLFERHSIRIGLCLDLNKTLFGSVHNGSCETTSSSGLLARLSSGGLAARVLRSPEMD